MKIIAAVAGATILWGALGAAQSAEAGELRLRVASDRAGGRIAVAVYRDADSLRRGENAVRTVMAPHVSAVTEVRIADLPPGRYAVAAFHDQDGDGGLTLWPIGLPREAYGFSRDARGRFGPPPFDGAAFDLPAAGAVQALRLR